MKSREDLILENIELEQLALKYKKGLHLAKKFIDSHIADPDLNNEMYGNYAEYSDFIKRQNLTKI